MRGFRALAACLLLPAAGCAAVGGAPHTHSSFLGSDIPAADVPALSAAVASFVTMRAPPGPIAVQSPDEDKAGMAERISNDLRAAGHVVSETGRNRLSYQASRMGDAVLLRMALDNDKAARVLVRGQSGALQPSGPVTLTLGRAAR